MAKRPAVQNKLLSYVAIDMKPQVKEENFMILFTLSHFVKSRYDYLPIDLVKLMSTKH